MAIFSDVAVMEHRLTVCHRRICFPKIDPAFPKRLDLRPLENEARFNFLLNRPWLYLPVSFASINS